VEKRPELDLTVAPDARVGRPPTLIGRDEWADDDLIELFSRVEEVKGHVYLVGNAPRVVGGVGAATEVEGAFGPLVRPEP